MHPVLGKIQFKSFEGLYDINGTQREVAFVDKDGEGPSVLAIRGLSVEDAIHVLHQLSGGLLKGKDAEQLPLPNTNGVKKDAKPAEIKKETKVASKPTPAPEPEPEADDEPADEDDLADEVEPALTNGDIASMAKMEKLRPVIELMISKGYKTSKAITEISVKVKDKVPALQVVDAKGNFAERMERSAMAVLGHE